MAAAVPLILARATRRSFLSLFSSSEQLSDEIAMAEKETSDIIAKDKKLRDEGTGNLEQTVKTMSDMNAATKIQAIGARPLLARRALARAATKIQAIGARPLLARRAFQRLRRARAATKIQASGARPLLARRALHRLRLFQLLRKGVIPLARNWLGVLCAKKLAQALDAHERNRQSAANTATSDSIGSLQQALDDALTYGLPVDHPEVRQATCELTQAAQLRDVKAFSQRMLGFDPYKLGGQAAVNPLEEACNLTEPTVRGEESSRALARGMRSVRATDWQDAAEHLYRASELAAADDDESRYALEPFFALALASNAGGWDRRQAQETLRSYGQRLVSGQLSSWHPVWLVTLGRLVLETPSKMHSKNAPPKELTKASSSVPSSTSSPAPSASAAAACFALSERLGGGEWLTNDERMLAKEDEAARMSRLVESARCEQDLIVTVTGDTSSALPSQAVDDSILPQVRTPKSRGMLRPPGPAERWAEYKSRNAEMVDSEVASIVDEIMNQAGQREFKELVLRTCQRTLFESTLDSKQRIRAPIQFIFGGSSGTGKARAARTFAKLLHALDLSNDEFIEASGLHGGKQVLEKYKEARGGVFFLCDAPGLRVACESAAKHAIDTMLEDAARAAEDPSKKRTTVILSGRCEELEMDLHKHEPRLRGRFVEVVFEDYNRQELRQIFLQIVHNAHWRLEDKVADVVANRVARGRNMPGFGNARDVQRMFERAYTNALIRTSMKCPRSDARSDAPPEASGKVGTTTGLPVKSSKDGSQWQCVDPAGVAYRNSPSVEDRAPGHGPSHGSSVTAIDRVGEDGNWLQVVHETGTKYLPIMKDGRVLFASKDNVKVPQHEHILKFHRRRRDQGYTCDMCNSSFSGGEHTYLCSACDFDACLSCASKFFPQPGKSQSDSQPAKSKGEDRSRAVGTTPGGDGPVLTMVDCLGACPDVSDRELSQALEELHTLAGLEEVRKGVHGLIALAQTNYERELNGGEPMLISLNRLFLGNPGTGKTTVATIYGRILKCLGLLSNGGLVMCTPSDLIGKYVGDTEAKVSQYIARAAGKVLVIDEAYALHTSSFGKTALDTLVSKVHNRPGEDIAVIMIGYEDEMKEMITKNNPGLQRRFPFASAFRFPDFSNVELEAILADAARAAGLHIRWEVRRAVVRQLARDRIKPNFGNAGAVVTALSAAQQALAADGYVEATELQLRHFGLSADEVRSGGAALAQAERALGKLVKVEGLRDHLRETSAMISQLERDGKLQPSHPAKPIGNYIFLGAPGTGKTSAASLLASFLQASGVLASEKVVMCSALDLQGSYVGQTKDKVTALMDEAVGGVLFIDEAYALGGTPGAHQKDSFCEQAVDQLTALMTTPKHLHRTVVVLAGYREPMQQMLKSVNPGFRSRFSQELSFPDWDADDCLACLRNTCKMEEVALDTDAELTLRAGFELLRHLPGWANARDAVGLYTQMYSARAVRLAAAAASKQGGNAMQSSRSLLKVDADAALGRMLAARGATAKSLLAMVKSVDQVTTERIEGSKPALRCSFESGLLPRRCKSTPNAPPANLMTFR